MPINKKDDGWYWGSQGPFKSKDKAEEVQRAAYASGYEKSEEEIEKIGFLAALSGLGRAAGAAGRGVGRDAVLSSLSSDEEEEDGDHPINAFEMSKAPKWVGDLRERAKKQDASSYSTRKREFAPIIDDKVTPEEVTDMEAEAERKKVKWKKNQNKWDESFGEGMTDPGETFGNPKPVMNMTKEGDGGGIGTVAVSSDPGVFTETYGARKKKIMNRSNKVSPKKNQKSGPEKLNDWLKNTEKSLDDESFLVELIEHVGTELRKAGEGPTGVYTPENERPERPPFPQETKRKGKGRDEEINRSPTTENTVPVTNGQGALGQSSVPQETVMAEVGVDDQRNMKKPIPRKKKKMDVPVVGAFLTPCNESGMNFLAMQKMPTHGNVTANTPKQFSTERPQEPYIERKPRLDPNSDIEQEEFVGNVDSIKDEDKNRKGRTYENNKDSNNIRSTNITQYSVHGGSPLQAFIKEMRDIGIDSLHRESDDDITEPDDYVLEDVEDEENDEIPSDKDEIKAEKAQVKKMIDWINLHGL